MRVKATERGYDNTAVREPGEEFDMPDDTVIEKGCWFEKVGKKGSKSPAGSTDGSDDANALV